MKTFLYTKEKTRFAIIPMIIKGKFIWFKKYIAVVNYYEYEFKYHEDVIVGPFTTYYIEKTGKRTIRRVSERKLIE